MPRHTRYVKNKRVGQRGTIVRGDKICIPMDGLTGGATGQGIYEASVIQRYDIGTRRITPDGRVYRYGKCIQTITNTNIGCKNERRLACQKRGACKAAAAGASVIEVATDDFIYTLAKDELRGGYVSLYPDGDRQQRMITHNTAVPVCVGATCFITLADPLSTALTLGRSLEILGNPYRYLCCDNNVYTAVMGMPTRLALINEYFWIQTWGPCRISPEGTGYGDADKEQQFVFGSTGGIKTAHEGYSGAYAGLSCQHAGFCIEVGDRANPESAAPFIMLQISP